jgi:hypothetical protein
VQRALAQLVDAGKLGVERGGGRRNSNHYRMEDSFAGEVRSRLKGKRKGGAHATLSEAG